MLLALGVLVGGALLLARAVHGLDATGAATVPSPRTVTYMTVTGDTAAGVESELALDPAIVMQATGTSAPTDLLPAGRSLRIDVARLWARLTQPATADAEALVEGEARSMGVDPALAVAVGWQESRLDQSQRSDTGAVGIMQVEPDTARLAARDLNRRIDPGIQDDNVIAGLFWLRSLLHSYHGNAASALAAYYEGPGNLARRGYLEGTEQYVRRAQQLRMALLTANPHLAS